MQMPGVDSMDLLRRMQARRPDVPVVMLAGDPNVHAAIAAIPEGAFDCVPKPFDDESLAAVVERALEMASLKRENDRLRDQLEAAISAAGFVAESGKIVPRRLTGVCTPHQRRLSTAIKQARNIALLPFAGRAS